MEPPKYLTSPGHAVAERQRWESEVRRDLLLSLNETRVNVVTAAAFPGWARAAALFIGKALKVPRDFIRRVLVSEPLDPDLTNEEIVDRLAPTLATAAYNVHVLSELAARGIPFKMWLTRHDPKVRHTHAEADGQKVPLSKPFTVGGEFLQFPADSSTARIDLWINCRCVALGREGP